MMNRLYDHQMNNLADFDCFSQVIFKSVEDYKRIKEDPWYKEHLVGDHENFADTKRSMMTIGWVSEFVNEGHVVDGFNPDGSLGHVTEPARVARGQQKSASATSQHRISKTKVQEDMRRPVALRN